MYINYIIPVILLVLSIVLLTGRGSWLIAGYNTSTKENKSKYDSKKLSRAAGIMLLIVTASVILTTAIPSQLVMILSFVVIIISVIVTIAYMNTKCKKPEYKDETYVNKNSLLPETRTRSTKNPVIIIIVVVVAAIFIIGSMIYTNQPTAYSIKNGTFEISSIYGETINLSDINSVQLKSELPTNLEKVNGASGIGSVLKGEFSSDAGNVMLFVDSSINSYIYIDTNSGFVIINDQSVNKTQDLYNELLDAKK